MPCLRPGPCCVLAGGRRGPGTRHRRTSRGRGWVPGRTVSRDDGSLTPRRPGIAPGLTHTTLTCIFLPPGTTGPGRRVGSACASRSGSDSYNSYVHLSTARDWPREASGLGVRQHKRVGSAALERVDDQGVLGSSRPCDFCSSVMRLITGSTSLTNCRNSLARPSSEQTPLWHPRCVRWRTTSQEGAALLATLKLSERDSNEQPLAAWSMNPSDDQGSTRSRATRVQIRFTHAARPKRSRYLARVRLKPCRVASGNDALVRL